MARPSDKMISEQEQQMLKWNLNAMSRSFSGKLISGKKLHLLKRYMKERDNFDDRLKDQHPILHEALNDDELLPSGKTLTKHLEGPTPYKTVEKIALFCTRVFAFPHEITADDLLTQNLLPFPPMRKTSGLWGRYIGIYRTFYFEPNENEDKLSGALLQLKEAQGDLRCRMVIGIKTEYCFEKVEELLRIDSSKDFVNYLDRLNKENRNDSAQMYYYEGTIDDRTVPEYYLIQLRRYESQHAMTIFLRSWSKSQKPLYSGGIATVIRCRKEEILSYPMIVTREKFSLIGDKDLMMKHLQGTLQENSLKETKDMDESLDREARARN